MSAQDSQPSVVRLGDLLDDPALNLRLVVGGESARRRRILGTHPLEIEEPSKWLGRGWVMLTVGMRLLRHPKEQRALVAELDDSGVAALGFGEGVVFDTIPKAILDEASNRGFPVFAIPPETPFREVIAASYRGSLSAESGALKRVTAMQQNLIEALGDEAPPETVIERLGWIVGGTVALLGADGEVMISTGTLPSDALRSALEGQNRLTEVDADGWRFIIAPVRVQPTDQPLWLAAGSSQERFNESTVEPAVRAAVPLIVALLRLNEVGDRQDRASRAALLEQILNNRRGYDLVELAHRARAFGLDFEDSTIGFTIRSRSSSSPASGPLAAGESATSRRLLRGIQQLVLPYLALVRQAETVVVVQAKKPAILTALFDDVIASDRDLLIAVGHDVREIADIPGSIDSASLVGRWLAEQQYGPQLASVSDLDLPRALLAQATTDLIDPIVHRLLDPITERPQLLETLVVYFAHDLDVPATAKALYLHPNTLRYRLRQIENLVGSSLHNPGTLSSLYLALQVRDSGAVLGAGG